MKAQEIVERIKDEKAKEKKPLTQEDLLIGYDESFVQNLYRKILGRDPDPHGRTHYLTHLRSGTRTKTEIATDLLFSPEAKAKGVLSQGLWMHRMLFLLHKIPVVGTLVKWLQYHLFLPRYIQRLHALENSALGAVEALQKRVDAINDRIQSLEKAEQRRAEETQKNEERLTSLDRRLKAQQSQLEAQRDAFAYAQQLKLRFESAPSPQEFLSFNADLFYKELEEAFRWDPTERLKRYLPFVKGERLVDIGCGRGEWLDLLQENGFQPEGVELNRLFLEALQKKGHRTHEKDALAFLKECGADSLDTLSAFHLVEHFEFDYLMAFLREAFRTLRPSGVLILETPNPKNLGVGACNFYIDPTHKRPLPPVLLEFLLRYSGFRIIKVIAPKETIELKEKALEGFVSEWVAQPQDYGIVALKP